MRRKGEDFLNKIENLKKNLEVQGNAFQIIQNELQSEHKLMMPGKQNRRETASQRQALGGIRRSVERKKAEAERKPINYNEIRQRERGSTGQNQNLPASPQAKELENVADFFMNDTENLKKFGEDFDLQDSERPRGGEDEEGQR